MTEFINGVEYLYTIPAEEPISYWILLVIFLICSVVFCVISLANLCHDYDVDVAIVTALLLTAIATLLSFFVIKNHNDNELNPERYAVHISDEVSMNEFTDNYTIVEQKGNVYIIEVKDNEHD